MLALAPSMDACVAPTKVGRGRPQRPHTGPVIARMLSQQEAQSPLRLIPGNGLSQEGQSAGRTASIRPPRTTWSRNLPRRRDAARSHDSRCGSTASARTPSRLPWPCRLPLPCSNGGSDGSSSSTTGGDASDLARAEPPLSSGSSRPSNASDLQSSGEFGGILDIARASLSSKRETTSGLRSCAPTPDREAGDLEFPERGSGPGSGGSFEWSRSRSAVESSDEGSNGAASVGREVRPRTVESGFERAGVGSCDRGHLAWKRPLARILASPTRGAARVKPCASDWRVTKGPAGSSPSSRMAEGVRGPRAGWEPRRRERPRALATDL